MTNFRELCNELLDELKYQTDWSIAEELKERASAALAEPEPEEPTDEELLEEWRQLMGSPKAVLAQPMLDFARAVLACWGNYPASADSSTPQPIPVTERLPGPEDCDGEGNVWAWRRFDPEGGMDNGDFWCLASCEWLGGEDSGFTHWLSAHALPVPS